MHNESIQHIVEAINNSTNILLGAHHKLDADSAGSIMALYHVLTSLGKNPTALTFEPIPKPLQFLPGIDTAFKHEQNTSKDFVITLFNPNTTVGEVKYTTTDKGYLNIIITPKTGGYSKDNVTISGSPDSYDLIIIVDSGDSKNIGPLYDDNQEMFEKAVVVNIDHHKTNDHFGDINYVDTKASSASEQVYYIIKELNETLITEDIATCLLTGVIADTGSFMHANTSAPSLKTASQLVQKGARQQDIIHNLFKSKRFSTLKLWGKILAHTKINQEHRVLWSYISERDLAKFNASADEVHGIVDDLLTTAPEIDWVLLFTEIEPGTVKVSVRTTSDRVDGTALCSAMGGGGHARACGYTVHETSLEIAMEQAISKVKELKKAPRIAEEQTTPSNQQTRSKQEQQHGDNTISIAQKLEQQLFGK